MRVLTNDIPGKEGQDVELFGWADARRAHGKILFIDLRDRSGVAQLTILPKPAELFKAADEVRPEWVLRVRGTINKRPAGMENSHLPTGNHEVLVKELTVLSKSEALPIPIDTDGLNIEEDMRLKYRYLDLRRSRLQKNMRLRAKFLDEARKFLVARDFIEIETPLLTKSTPEGSRDFLVPSRLSPGKFYALPQSPQQYKQLLMVAGFERYFQFARALRDEDLRADRTFEHTQIDLEMSFVERDDVMSLIEEMIVVVWESMGKKIKAKPFPRFTYSEAMEKFGADKFDMRSDDEKKESVFAFAWVTDFPVFSAEGGSASGGEKKLTYSHNPFTGMKQEDEEKLMKGESLETLSSLQYDLVCNGHEVGGGGIRIHKPEVLKKVFEVIGHKPEDIEAQFGHILEAFSYGVPPHGGIALGVERLIALLAGEDHIRETQAFPTNSSGRTSVMQAPSEVSRGQLDELGISIKKHNAK
ncbi:MAG: aspartate--tRNA ligase [Candidatus Liptonbacteria bacterium]|nr:aspartate--tRNA ligase [Candidatus Liptonbacteria bacterium]